MPIHSYIVDVLTRRARSLFPGTKPLLDGALAVSASLEGGAYELHVVPVINALEWYRPTEAKYVGLFWF